jgi:hypothetical protein
MDFGRALSEQFIAELNTLHSNENSWWHKMVEDDDVFILIRKNRVHVLVNGGLLLQVEYSKGKLVCKTHEQFLSLRSKENSYVTLHEDKTSQSRRVQGLKDLVEHYEKVKRRIKLFTGREKQVVQNLGLCIEEIVDLEVGLEGEKKKGASRKGAQRIDMAGISNDSKLVFFEVKLFDNSEIRSKGVPKVVGQLKKYDGLLGGHQGDIIRGYEEQFEMYKKLHGKFFKKRRTRTNSFRDLDIYRKARLIITDFDGSQKEFLYSTILRGIRDGMGWDDKGLDLIVMGNHKNIKQEALFKGL